MAKQYFIAPSILAADVARLGEESKNVLDAGANWIHFDVMDNHFVPNLTMGPMFCQGLRDFGITAPLDVHLMIEPVDAMISTFAKIGASHISFHPEATADLRKTIGLIKDHRCKVGIAINPETSIDCLHNILNEIDIVLMMSVHPGFSGQKMIPGVLDKIKVVRQLIDQQQKEILITIDGGIHDKNIGEAVKAGANVFVSGAGIFRQKDYQQIIQLYRKNIEAAVK